MSIFVNIVCIIVFIAIICSVPYVLPIAVVVGMVVNALTGRSRGTHGGEPRGDV